MDDSLDIRVNVNTASVSQLKEELTKLKTTLSQLPATSPEFKEGAAQAGQLSARIKDLNYQMNGLSGAVKSARTEHRMFRFAIFEVVGGMTALGSAIDDISGGGDKLGKLTKSMQGGFAAGMGMKFGLDMLGESFAKVSGPVAIGVGLFTAIAGAFSSAGKEAKDTAPEIHKLNEEINATLLKLGMIQGGEGGMVNLKQTQLSGVRAQISQLSRPVYSQEARAGGTYRGPGGDLIVIAAKEAVLDTAKMAENEAKVVALRVQETQLMAETAGYQEKITKSTEGFLKLYGTGFGLNVLQEQVAFNARAEQAGVKSLAYGPGLRGGGGEKFNPFNPTVRAKLGEYKDTNFGETQAAKMRKAEADEEQKRMTDLVDHMKSGFTQATDVLAQGFVKAFHLGDSLLDTFLSTFLGALASAGMGYLTGSIFQSLGLTKAGSSIVGVSGDIAASMRGGYSGGSVISVVPIVNNAGLAVQLETGNRFNKSIRY
jgi:hypothetical protein